MSSDSQLGTAGLPLGKIEHVVDVMVLASCDPDLKGATLPVDASGAFLIPWEAGLNGALNYYRAFEQRATLLANITGTLRGTLAGGFGVLRASLPWPLGPGRR